MAIPDFQSIMLPLLQIISDGREYHLRESVGSLSEHFELTDEERMKLLPSGRYPTFDNRVSWAGSYLNAAGLLKRPKRGYMKITDRGLKVLEEDPPEVDIGYLERYPEFVTFRDRNRKSPRRNSSRLEKEPSLENPVPENEQTPSEMMETSHQSIRSGLADEILQQIRSCTPEFFERLVVDLLVRMGYGGTRADAGRAVGKSGDGGIDGIINEDRLGLDVIYLQAKRWENTVGRPQIQQFAGALQGRKARKGVFITTSNFSQGALDYARDIESSLVLVDGETLAGLMIDHDVGVTLETSYEIKRIDSDYFEEV